MAKWAQGSREDMRQKRTRRHLADALMGLMEERSFRDISVVDICDRAMVHRTTFYAHFADKEDLFRYVLEETLRTVTKPKEKADESVSFRETVLEEVRRGLAFLRAHRRFYLSGLEGGAGPEQRVLEDIIAQAIQQLVMRKGWPEEEATTAELMSVFYSGAIVNVVRWWLVNNVDISEEELVGHLATLLPPPGSIRERI